MRTSKKWLAGLLGGMAAVASVASGAISSPARGDTPAGAVWDFATDFGAFPNQLNPIGDDFGNTDVWAYMRGAAQATSGYTLLTDFTRECTGDTVDHWRGPGGFRLPVVAKNSGPATTCGSPFATGEAYVHPDGSQDAIIRWKSPVTGSVAVTGSVGVPSPGSNGITWSIDKGSSIVASGSIGPDSSQLFSAGTGGASLTSVAVTAGDSLYLVVGDNDQINSDLTKVTFTITLNAPEVTTTTEETTTTTQAPTTTTQAPTTTTSTTLPSSGEPHCEHPTRVVPADWKKNKKFYGTEGDDIILGRFGDDVIDGLGGNDIICPRDGKDIVYGGGGNDQIYGRGGGSRSGSSKYYGGPGNDAVSILGGSKNALNGDDGDDYLYGSSGVDYMRGGNGNDVLYGGDGNDQLSGMNGDDSLNGEAGNDVLDGSRGHDYCHGGDGWNDKAKRSCEVVTNVP